MIIRILFEDPRGDLENWRYFIGKIVSIGNICREKEKGKNASQPFKCNDTMTPDINLHTLKEFIRFRTDAPKSRRIIEIYRRINILDQLPIVYDTIKYKILKNCYGIKYIFRHIIISLNFGSVYQLVRLA